MSVFPVPGGPNSKIPRTCFIPVQTQNKEKEKIKLKIVLY